MNPEYLDVLFVGLVGLAALGAYFQLNRERKSRLVIPVKARRKEEPMIVRRPRNWRW